MTKGVAGLWIRWAARCQRQQLDTNDGGLPPERAAGRWRLHRWPGTVSARRAVHSPRLSPSPGHEAPAGQGASMTSDREADALSSHLLGIAVGAARDAGAYFTPYAGKIAFDEKKGFYDPVTECDKESERRIVERIFREHPDSTIVGEEGGQQGSGDVHWYVDPIDGTNNFVAGIPFFCVSIAAALGDRLLAGVVYDPSRDEVFAASLAGATVNGEPMRCSGGAVDSGATLVFEHPRSGRPIDPEELAFFAKLLPPF